MPDLIGHRHFNHYQKASRAICTRRLLLECGCFILSDYKLDCFEAKSPTFVGLFMDKKSMLRNGVENFRAC
jgi:hypothetical protein